MDDASVIQGSTSGIYKMTTTIDIDGVKGFKIALIQLAVCSNKADNLCRAAWFIQEAARKGAQLVALPECFNTPHGRFVQNAEEVETGESSLVLSKAAKDNQIYLIGGSFPERSNGKLYNTCTVWGPDGSLLAVHRKLHSGKRNENGHASACTTETVVMNGDELTSFQFGDICKVGIGLSDDIKFPEVARLYTQHGCKLLIFPGAFNITNGPVHWELLHRCRAFENQVYVAAVSPARSESSSFVVWGHSSIASPWGLVVATTDHTESVVYADIDLEYLEKVRTETPLIKKRRLDIYQVTECTDTSM